MVSASFNGLICFTNCLLAQEDGSLVEKDLWVDETRGLILDAQKAFYTRRQRPDRIIDLEGNILSPGFLDIQLNGAYNFDFSVYEGDEEAYRQGLEMVAERIVETGITSLLPTVITQEKATYPKLLSLLKPFSTPTSATLLGWHAEGPFIDLTKRGAHSSAHLLEAPSGFQSLEEVYGPENLVESEDWTTSMSADQGPAVRLITAAPEVPGIMGAIGELNKRGIAFSIGHSVASSEVATTAVQRGARLITHLFNAMPQLHHRDPSIIGLLGASPHLYSPTAITTHLPCCSPINESQNSSPSSLEAFPTILSREGTLSSGAITPLNVSNKKKSRPSLHLEKGQIADMEFERPYYGLIVDGVHCHPNSVRLAYSSHPDGCILVTDAVKILDPKLQDGVHEWHGGRKIVKEGDKIYLEGTTILAGRRAPYILIFTSPLHGRLLK